ncbi:MAG: ISL3 family transposase [Oceanospirillaceae bacterium]|nr:ISL3 family transposase [Oceanospirillaceae bacterium]
MDQQTLYERILGLSAPWRVLNVDLDEQSGEVRVHIDCDAAAVLACPECGRAAPRYDSRTRTWRHLDTCQFQTLVIAAVPRIQCEQHGCRTVQVPWAEGNSRDTQLFEVQVIRWLQEASIRAVSRQLKLSWNAIDGIMARAVKRGLDSCDECGIQQLAVDETSFRKGHDYVTVVSNALGQVLAVEDGKSSESLSRFYQKLSEPQRDQIQSVSMDMSPAFQKATLHHVPSAQKKIAFDHFHIAQALTDALNATRKAELLTIDSRLRLEIHRSRFHWLRSRHSLADHHRQQLNSLATALSDTALVWYFKEKARDIWKGNRVRGAKAAWEEWIGLAKASLIRPLMAVARTIEDHLWGILNAMRLQASNALAEAINSKIRMLRVRAYGYRNKDRFKRAILFHFGGLPLEPTHCNG